MRVAVVNRHLRDAVGGSELQCHLVATGLAGRGHTVRYLALDGAAQRAGDHDLRYELAVVPDDARAIVAAVRAFDADVVYWRRNRAGLRGVVAGLRSHGIPLVFAVAHVDDVSAVPPSLRRPIRRAARLPLGAWARGIAGARDLRRLLRHRREGRALRQVAAVASQRRDFMGRLPVVDERYVPNMMDTAVEPFAWPRPYVAWVGNLKPRKRPELIPSIADVLAPLGVDVVVAGPVQAGEYPWLAHDAGRPNLHAVGRLTPAQVTGLLEGARCLVVTGAPEGFSNVALQAWWGGTPTVLLEDDPDGLVAAHGMGAVAGGDVARLLELVRQHADDGVVARSAGARAQAYARTVHASGPVLDVLEQLLADVVSAQGPRRDVG
jgi:glycosyltransferase involved in cell wall biosynthesis